MTILYFGAYDPNYPRNKTLIKGLRENGAEVIECNSRSRSFVKYIELFFKYLKIRGNYDVIVIGFPGQESMFLASLLTFRLGSKQAKPIIFDVFTSHYGGHVLDRGKHGQKSFRSQWYWWIDKKSVELSDIALLDTDAHIDFFEKEFNLPRAKFKRIFVGTDSSIFYPRETKKNTDKFLVHFHGHYIPLQGVEYIIRAAKLLEKENIVFNLIGRGQTYLKNRELAERLRVNNINFIDRVPYEKLSDYINTADMALGIFGNTLKTELVIPNKVFEAIACAKPVVTAETRAARELFIDWHNVLFCRKADPENLAEKIIILRKDQNLRRKISEAGYLLYQNQLQEKDLAAPIIKFINEYRLLSK